MALQGTLDTFSLPDVLRLLAATRKSGCLELSGQRASGDPVDGRVWVDDGRALGVSCDSGGAAPSGGLDPVVALFELLRTRTGSFTFMVDAEPPDGVRAARPGREIEDMVGEAEDLLEEWQALEAVVPSMACSVRLRPTLDQGAVTLDAETWSTLVAAAGAGDVAGLGRHLDLDDLTTSRRVSALVELGVLDVGAPEAPRGDRTPPGPVVASPTPAGIETPVVATIEQDGPVAAGPSGREPVGAEPGDPEPRARPPVDVGAFSFASFDDEPCDDEPVAIEPRDASPGDAEPVAVESRDASPGAVVDAVSSGVVADAVSSGVVPDAVLAELSDAAARSVSRLDPESGPGEIDDGAEDPLDRGMLLRFLSSVKH